jgi:hypothetical protein
MAKAQNKVTVKRRLPIVAAPFSTRREWRLTTLARFVSFAYLPSSELIEEADRMELEVLGQRIVVAQYVPGDGGIHDPLAVGRLNYFKALQMQLRSGLEQLASGDDDWILPPTRLRLGCDARKFVGHNQGDWGAVFLRECAVLINGLERSRLQKCSESGCDSVFVKIKKARYCATHSSARARSKRYRDGLDPAKIKERAHGYYLKRLAKKRLAARRKLKGTRPRASKDNSSTDRRLLAIRGRCSRFDPRRNFGRQPANRSRA